MKKRIFNSLGYAAAKCMKFWLFAMIPTIWYWFPILAVCEFIDRKEEKGE